ncbi:hypothetical protein RhiJN_04777 [Ceratobasidium sp. AG-Ba]|nr:hypothetical protein RhiJN_04777 [Ceratobasidium sp. AG-Ba]
MGNQGAVRATPPSFGSSVVSYDATTPAASRPPTGDGERKNIRALLDTPANLLFSSSSDEPSCFSCHSSTLSDQLITARACVERTSGVLQTAAIDY